MARGDSIPDDNEVARWIKPKLLGRDDDDNVVLDAHGRPVFVFPAAFELRDDEDSLSVTWLQYFAEGRAQHLPKAADAFRQTTRSGKLQAQSAFAIAKVGALKETGVRHDLKLRILEDPIDGNPGHSEIRRYPREMGEFQAVLATDTFGEAISTRFLEGPAGCHRSFERKLMSPILSAAIDAPCGTREHR